MFFFFFVIYVLRVVGNRATYYPYLLRMTDICKFYRILVYVENIKRLKDINNEAA